MADSMNQRPYRASPRARRKAAELDVSVDKVRGTSPSGHVMEQDVIAYVRGLQSKEALLVTPLAKRMAALEGVPLDKVTGSGTGGKIRRKDVESWMIQHRTAKVSPRPLSTMRKIIGKRMSYSVQTIPHVTLFTEAEVSRLIAYRQQVVKQHGKVTFTDLIVKACAFALKKHPYMNVSIQDDDIHYHEHAHIGVAVAVDEGLLVPVVKRAEEKNVPEIAGELKQLVEKARSGKLHGEDLSGGTFTVSNLGTYDIDGFTPVINPPEAAILGIGRIKETVVVLDGAIRLGNVMSLSLSFDHRATDGAPAAAFLTAIKEILEDPAAHFA